MKKLIYLIVLILILGLIVSGCIPVVPSSEQNELDNIVRKNNVNENNKHKIRNKWDLEGSFVTKSGHNWGIPTTEGTTWKYSIHIKEAMNGEFSVGSIYFTKGDIEVIGHVKQTKNEYGYWYGISGYPEIPNLAAAGIAGIAENNDVTYNFLFLFNERAMWFALSQENIEQYWESDTVWPKSSREYQLHSTVYEGQFIMEPKEIH